MPRPPGWRKRRDWPRKRDSRKSGGRRRNALPRPPGWRRRPGSRKKRDSPREAARRTEAPGRGVRSQRIRSKRKPRASPKRSGSLRKRLEDERLAQATRLAEEKWAEEERLAQEKRDEESRQAEEQRLAEERWAAEERRRVEEQRTLEAQWFTPDPQSTWSQPPAVEQQAPEDDAARHRDLTEDAARLAEAMRLAAESLGAPEEPPLQQPLTPLPLISAPNLTAAAGRPPRGRAGRLHRPPAGADRGRGRSRSRRLAHEDRPRPPTRRFPPLHLFGHGSGPRHLPEEAPPPETPAEPQPIAQIEPAPELEPALALASREDEEQAMREARARAQEDVLREVQDALLRSATAEDDSWLQDSPAPAWSPAPPEWFDASTQPPAPEEPLPAIAPTEPAPTTEPGWDTHFPETAPPAAWTPMQEVPPDEPLPEVAAQPIPFDEATIARRRRSSRRSRPSSRWGLPPRPPPIRTSPSSPGSRSAPHPPKRSGRSIRRERPVPRPRSPRPVASPRPTSGASSASTSPARTSSAPPSRRPSSRWTRTWRTSSA